MGIGRGFSGKISLNLEEAMVFGANCGNLQLASLLQKEIEISQNMPDDLHNWIEVEVWGCTGRFEGDQGD